ncbi:MAG: methylthioribulose 1-phosphate dehydratase [Planctomycetales bacterium]|nr:methylthioribulose 1-phosphate dehydratase [Planctomycetales bacterium]
MDTTLSPALSGLEPQLDQLRETGSLFYQRGWSVGTSSNYSVVVDRNPLQLVVTASGKDKGRLARQDFVRVDQAGAPMGDGQPKSSAETLLHCVVAEHVPEVGAILHTHSVWSTVLSEHFFAAGGFEIAGYEMLKGLDGVTTHETSKRVEIFDNTQDIPALARQVERRLADANPLTHGYLIRRHGLYTWGKTLDDARRQVEIFEFLFECVARDLAIKGQLAMQP